MVSINTAKMGTWTLSLQDTHTQPSTSSTYLDVLSLGEEHEAYYNSSGMFFVFLLTTDERLAF